MPPISPDTLRHLSSGRWLIPILATMATEDGSRFSTLARQLAMSKSILSRSLDRLEEMGLIARNPGHGHPLRPEYLLTAEGRAAAAMAASVEEGCVRAAIAAPALGRWSLPLLHRLGQGLERFGELSEAMAPITPRALSMALTQLVASGLVEKLAEPAMHPRYRLSRRGRELAKSLREAGAHLRTPGPLRPLFGGIGTAMISACPLR